MIAGVAVTVDPEAVVVVTETPWQVVSSATRGGGVGVARSIVNLPKEALWLEENA
jgi:hypothetical protein